MDDGLEEKVSMEKDSDTLSSPQKRITAIASAWMHEESKAREVEAHVNTREMTTLEGTGRKRRIKNRFDAYLTITIRYLIKRIHTKRRLALILFISMPRQDCCFAAR